MVESTFFPQQLTDLLKEKAGLDDKLINDLFRLNEENGEWVLTAKGYIETSTYHAMQDLCQEQGGAFQPPKPPYKDNPAVFQIPVFGREVETSKAKNTTPEQLEMSKTESQPAKTIEVPLSSLQHNVFNPRKKRTKLDDLLESIPNEGLRERLVVRPHPRIKVMAEPRYQIISGHRRYEALKQLGWKKVPVIIQDMTDKQAYIEAVKSNLDHGKRLEPFDEAKWIKEELIDKQGMTQEEVAKEYNRTQQWVSTRLAMLEVPKTNGTNRFVSSTKAIEVAKVPEEDRQEIVDKIDREELSTRETKAVVAAIKEAPEKTKQVLTKQGVPKLYRCGFPDCMKGAYYPIFYEEVAVCPDCDRKIQEDPSLAEKLKEKPSQPQKIEKKKYVPPSDWRERMHVKVSKMEFEVMTELQAEGWPIDTEYWIPLTKPDGYLHEIRLPLEVDGEQVHKGKKAERDELVNEILRRRGMEPARERFSSYSVKRKEEIKACFRERMIQGYREKGLELPGAVKETQQP